MRVVRQAEDRDFERIVEVEQAAYGGAHSIRAQARDHLSAFPAGLFVDWKGRGYIMTLMVEKNQDLFDLKHCTGHDYLFITNVAVHPDHQGKGLGRRLVQHALDHFKLPGLLCVDPANDGAIALYKKMQFRKCGTVYRYFGGDGEASTHGNVMRQPIRLVAHKQHPV